MFLAIIIAGIAIIAAAALVIISDRPAPVPPVELACRTYGCTNPWVTNGTCDDHTH